MRSLRLGFPLLAAIVFPVVATLRANPGEYWQYSAGLPLFGWFRLFVAHDLLALPLGWMIARFVQGNFIAPDSPRMRIATSIGCILLLFFWPQVLSACTAFFDQADAGISFRSVGRGLLLAMVQAMVLLACKPPAALRPPAEALAFASAFMLAVAPPAIYAHRLEVIHGDRLEILLESGRFKAARTLCYSLRQLGSQRQHGNKSLSKLIEGLDSQINSLEKSLRRSGEGVSPTAATIEIAYQHFQLDDFLSAEKILAELKGKDTQSTLVLGSLYREQERWGEMADLFAGLIDHVPQELKPLCFESLAEALRNLDRPGEAETIYRRAIREIPNPAGFHLKLGLLLADLARTSEAIEQLELAVSLQPRLARQAEAPLRSLKTTTWSCLDSRPATGRNR